MAITKFESYYNKIREKLEVIQSDYSYSNLSLAFAHWFLQTKYQMDDQKIAESLIDGNGDNGIDAIFFNEEEKMLKVIQFKFPQSASYLNKEIDQNAILKLKEGFEMLIGRSGDSPNSSEQFKEHKELLKDKEVFNFNLTFVSFNKGIVDNKHTIENFVNSFKEETGSTITYDDFNKNHISNLYEKINRTNSVEINLKYKLMQPAYKIEEIDSYMGVINGVELVEAIKDKLLVIFDENIRLVEKNSKVNEKIKQTATSAEANMFYFYNNGIVFICDNANISPNSLSIRLKGASIVNGCQTTNALISMYESGELSHDVDLLVRIIEISDYDERTKITEYLNSQNPIKDSYFISNHTIVRDLQKSLIEHNYYLERQIDEATYRKEHGTDISDDLEIIKLEDIIQYYTGYWLNKFVATAKSAKGNLFNSDKIEEILSEITAKRVIEAYKMYQMISEVLTKYRKLRRSDENKEFSTFMGIDNDIILNNISDYLFVNTGDLLILNAVKNLKKRYKELNIAYTDKKLIRDSIIICKNIIEENKDSFGNTPATITKNAKVYTITQKYISNLTEANISL